MNNIDENEIKRLVDLETLRTFENSHLIDEARRSGASVQDTLRNIIKANIENDKATQEIVGYMNDIVNKRNGMVKNTLRQAGAYSYLDVDHSLTAEDQQSIAATIEEMKNIYKQREGK